MLIPALSKWWADSQRNDVGQNISPASAFRHYFLIILFVFMFLFRTWKTGRSEHHSKDGTVDTVQERWENKCWDSDRTSRRTRYRAPGGRVRIILYNQDRAGNIGHDGQDMTARIGHLGWDSQDRFV
jgi:hypothetical protein